MQTVFVFTAEEKRPYPAAQQGNSMHGREGKAKGKAPCACWPPPPPPRLLCIPQGQAQSVPLYPGKK